MQLQVIDEAEVEASAEDVAPEVTQNGGYRLWISCPCGVTFDRVKVRYHPKVILEVHIDTDEGNACDLDSATHMELFK